MRLAFEHHSMQPGTKGRRSMAIMSKEATSNTCRQAMQGASGWMCRQAGRQAGRAGRAGGQGEKTEACRRMQDK